MAPITIGAAAIDRTKYGAITSTIVGKEGAASGSGKINSVEIWLDVDYWDGADVEVATFIDEGSNVLSTRGSELLGDVAKGSKQTFSGLDMDVVAGDYLGIYGTAGLIEQDWTGGEGLWYLVDDRIPCSSVTFNWLADRTISLYGESLVLHEKEITEGIAVGEALVKQPIKIVSEGVALSEVLTKAITKAPFVEGIAIGEVLTKVQIHVRTIIEGIAIGETVTKAVTKVITEGIAIGEVLVKMRVLRAIRNLLSVREQKAARQKDKERQL